MEKLNYKMCKEEIEQIFKTISPQDENGELKIKYSEFIAATLDQRRLLT